MGFSSGKNAPNNVDLTSSQTMSNKTLDGTTVIQDGATITTPDIISPSRLDVKKDTLANLQTYASSASNGQMCFATNTKQMFQVVDSALAEVSGGSGGINYISNGNYEQDTSGTTGDTNLTVSQESGSFKLRGDGSLKILKGAINASTQSVTIPFTIDPADLAQKLTISFDKDFSDPNYNDGDAQVRIIKDPLTTPVTIRVNGEDIAGGKNSHIAQFQTDATELDYALEIYWNDTAANAVSVYMDNIQVGPREVVKGQLIQTQSVLADGGSTASAGTVSNYTIQNQNGHALLVNTSGIWESQHDNVVVTATASGSIGASDSRMQVYFTIDGVNRIAGKDSFNNASGYESGSAGTFTLNKGDKVFAYASGTGVLNSVIFTFTAIRVGSNAVMSEDLGGREIVVEGAGNDSSAYTLNTAINFTETVDTTNSWDGSVFTSPETGYYSVTGNIRWNTNSIRTINSFKNGSTHRLLNNTNIVGGFNDFEQIVFLEKGDTYYITCSSSDTLSSNVNQHWISIVKLASPQTILETETVAARYTSSNAQVVAINTIVEFEELDYDTHNAYNTSTGRYTAPVSGYYDVMARLAPSNATAYRYIALKKNGTYISNKFVYTTGVNSAGDIQLKDTIYLAVGDYFEVFVRDIALTLGADSPANVLTISRIK